MAFLRLGVTSFGGPVAHLGYYRQDIVQRRGWLDERAYADLVALCQFLPGPASSQVGIGIGLYRAGLPGAFAAWIAVTLRRALLLIFVSADGSEQQLRSDLNYSRATASQPGVGLRLIRGLRNQSLG